LAAAHRGISILANSKISLPAGGGGGTAAFLQISRIKMFTQKRKRRRGRKCFYHAACVFSPALMRSAWRIDVAPRASTS